jgi:hypothetical protein
VRHLFEQPGRRRLPELNLEPVALAVRRVVVAATEVIPLLS